MDIERRLIFRGAKALSLTATIVPPPVFDRQKIRIALGSSVTVSSQTILPQF